MVWINIGFCVFLPWVIAVVCVVVSSCSVLLWSDVLVLFCCFCLGFFVPPWGPRWWGVVGWVCYCWVVCVFD